MLRVEGRPEYDAHNSPCEWVMIIEQEALAREARCSARVHVWRTTNATPTYVRVHKYLPQKRPCIFDANVREAQAGLRRELESAVPRVLHIQAREWTQLSERGERRTIKRNRGRHLAAKPCACGR